VLKLKDEDKSASQRPKTPKNCPHCGVALTLWEQCLLGVDRVLMCKNCWYKIKLKAFDDSVDLSNQTKKED